MQGKYKVGDVKQRSNSLVLRIVGDNLPEEFEKVNNDIDLVDVYLYYFEQGVDFNVFWLYIFIKLLLKG